MRWVAMGRLTCRIVTLPCVAAVLADLMIAGCGSVRLTGEGTTVAVPGSPVPASAIPRLRTIADQAVKETGGVAPSWISAVVTTQERALASVNGGSGPGGKTVVYLVTMKGQFKFERGLKYLKPEMGPQARGQRARAPALHYQYVVVSAKAFKVIAGGLSPKAPPVVPSSLGPVTWLKR